MLTLQEKSRESMRLGVGIDEQFLERMRIGSPAEERSAQLSNRARRQTQKIELRVFEMLNV